MTAYFTDTEAQAIRAEYDSGATIDELARKHFCCDKTLHKYIRLAGGTIRPYKSKYHTVKQMMINDWNTGRATKDMAKIYKVTHRQIGSLMCAWRSQGEEIEWRGR